MFTVAENRLNADHGSLMECNWYYGCILSPKQTAHECIIDYDEVSEKPNMNKHLFTEEPNTNPACQSLTSVSDSEHDEFEIEISEDQAIHQDLERMFNVLDEDGDGRVTTDEIMRFLQKLGLEMPKEEVEFVVRNVSVSENEYLTLMEFAKFYEILLGQGEEAISIDDGDYDDDDDENTQEICEAFGVFDQNGDGLISVMELSDILCKLGFVEGRDLHHCKRMIENVDYNGDGHVDLHEFKHLIMKTSNSCLI
eukprot:Gb_34519 [translate_table: standard]